jgi:hypothetical protein
MDDRQPSTPHNAAVIASILAQAFWHSNDPDITVNAVAITGITVKTVVRR